ncbi:unnamed protein product [Blepharisma stoltei]|uniref:Uncharacterized protein n=1 Tax=Blepharisma stoltei TaxID=1481888 RepID=A0AAU9J0Q3_9CILI|nr:unnamed protein product [Blepharisma stoltei]
MSRTTLKLRNNLTTILEKEYETGNSSMINMLKTYTSVEKTELNTTLVNSQLPESGSMRSSYPILTPLRKMLPQTSAKLMKMNQRRLKALKESPIISKKLSLANKNQDNQQQQISSQAPIDISNKLLNKLESNLEALINEIKEKFPQIEVIFDCYDNPSADKKYKYIYNIATNQQLKSIEELSENTTMILLTNRKNVVFDANITGFDPETNSIVNLRNIPTEDHQKYQPLPNSNMTSPHSIETKKQSNFYEILPIIIKKRTDYIEQPQVVPRKNYFSPPRYYHGRARSCKKVQEEKPLLKFQHSEVSISRPQIKIIRGNAGFRLHYRYYSAPKLKEANFTTAPMQKISLQNETKPVTSTVNFNFNGTKLKNDMVNICIKYNLTPEEFSTMVHDFVGLEIIGDTAGIVSKQEVIDYYKISEICINGLNTELVQRDYITWDEFAHLFSIFISQKCSYNMLCSFILNLVAPFWIHDASQMLISLRSLFSNFSPNVKIIWQKISNIVASYKTLSSTFQIEELKNLFHEKISLLELRMLVSEIKA